MDTTIYTVISLSRFITENVCIESNIICITDNLIEAKTMYYNHITTLSSESDFVEQDEMHLPHDVMLRADSLDEEGDGYVVSLHKCNIDIDNCNDKKLVYKTKN